MGPTIVTIPSVLRRIFAEAGARLEDYLELVRLDPQWRCFFDDGSALDLAQNPEAMAQTLDAFAPGTNSGQRYRDFIDYSARLDGISQRHFFYKPIGGIARHVRVEGVVRSARCSATCSRCAWAARSRARCANSRPIRASRR